MEMSRSGPEFVTRALESDDVPFFMVWGGEALGDELLARLAELTKGKFIEPLGVGDADE